MFTGWWMFSVLSCVASVSGISVASDTPKIVYVTPDIAWIEGSLDLKPFIQTILLVENATKLQNLSGFFQDQPSSKYATYKTLNDRITWSISSTKNLLSKLGISFTPTIDRNKREAPFSFVGDIFDLAFGLVSTSKFNNLKQKISQNFDNIYKLNKNLVSEINSQNRALTATLTYMNKTNNYLQNMTSQLDFLESKTNFLRHALSLDGFISALDKFQIMIMSIIEDADRMFPSRYLITENDLKEKLNLIGSNARHLYPAFGVNQSSNYYKIQSCITTLSQGTKFLFLVKVPLISTHSKYHISIAQDLVGYISLRNNFGFTAALPVSQYLMCMGSYIHPIPAICHLRICQVSDPEITCISSNLTSMVLHSNKEINLKIMCGHRNYAKTINQNITVLNLPLGCSVHGGPILVDKVASIKSFPEEPRIYDYNHFFSDSYLTDHPMQENQLHLSIKAVSDKIKSLKIQQLLKPTPLTNSVNHTIISSMSLTLSLLFMIALLVIAYLSYKKLSKYDITSLLK